MKYWAGWLTSSNQDCWEKYQQPHICIWYHSRGNQPWIFIGRIDAEAEAPILWPPDAKNWLIRKDPDAGKDWREEEKGMTEDKIVEWPQWLNGYEFEQALGDVKDWEAWRAAVHGVGKTWTWLSHWTTTTPPKRNWIKFGFLNNISWSINEQLLKIWFKKYLHNFP